MTDELRAQAEKIVLDLIDTVAGPKMEFGELEDGEVFQWLLDLLKPLEGEEVEAVATRTRDAPESPVWAYWDEDDPMPEDADFYEAEPLYTSPLQLPDAQQERPEVICLCGSTRFAEAYAKAYREVSLAGKIVLSVGVMVHAGEEPIRDDGPEKRGLDELHLRKIDLCDSVLVLNVGGYIGDSTRREIAYARSTGKPVVYLEPDAILSPEGDEK